MNWRAFTVLWLALATTLPALATTDLATGFDQANKLYEEGKFRDAAEAYHQLLATGQRSGALLFNLGNAQFKAGNLGQAIAAYRLASELTPRDPDLAANLQFARSHVTGPTLKPGWLERNLDSLTTNEWTLLAAVPVWLWLGLLTVRQIKPALKSSLRSATRAVGIVALLTVTLLGLALHHRFNERTVVVTARDAVARFGPIAESQSAFTAADGAELRLLDSKDGWLQVTDGGKIFGWLQTNTVIIAN